MGIKEMSSSKKVIVALGVVGLTAAAAVASVAAMPWHGQQGIGASTAVQDAIQANDYNAFVDAVSAVNPDAVSHITEDQFAMMAERSDAHDAMQAAIEADDYDAFFTALSQENPIAARHLTQEQFQQRVDAHTTHTAVEAALEAGDYDAWVAAVSALPHAPDIANIVTEDDFNTLVALHQARESGDTDTAKQLLQELPRNERMFAGGPGEGKGVGGFGMGGFGMGMQGADAGRGSDMRPDDAGFGAGIGRDGGHGIAGGSGQGRGMGMRGRYGGGLGNGQGAGPDSS